MATVHVPDHPLIHHKLAIVPILRAGLGMVDSMVALIPSAKIAK